MPVVVREGVEVREDETEIIEPQHTPHDRNRTFAVANGENEIEVKVFGSNDEQNWEERDSKIIPPNDSDSLICGPVVYWVKLVGKTTSLGTISKVDACLVYTSSPESGN